MIDASPVLPNLQLQHHCLVGLGPPLFKTPDAYYLSVGKVAVVTGSSRSIGASVAICLGEHGANVVVNYVSDSKAAEEVVQAIRSQGKGGAIAVRADAATIDGGKILVDEALKTFGRIDILVLNAGLMGSKTLSEVDESFLDAHFDANVKAPLFLVKTVVPHLPRKPSPVSFDHTVSKL